MKKIAIVCARGLGDALLSMILTHNFTKSGFDVTTFSTILCELKSWFPGYKIQPYPHDFSLLNSFDHIYAADHSGLSQTTCFKEKLTVLKETSFDKKKTIAANLAAFCKQMGLPCATIQNGIVIPENLKFRKYPRRIIIHPLSHDEKKNWPMDKFLLLSEKLLELGFEPIICMSPKERETWEAVAHKHPNLHFPHFPSVCELAEYVYESGFMIGNDSGIGHLASCLGIPTLSIFSRRSYSLLWRPGWGNNQVVTPPNILIGAHMKRKYWKKCLTVSKVLNAFI